MADAASIILDRLEYLGAQTSVEEAETAWIQFCEVVALAFRFHEAGLLAEAAMARVHALEAHALGLTTARRKKGSCRMSA